MDFRADEENDFVNRYEEILNRTQYFVAKNFKLTHESVDKTLIEYFKKGGKDKYLVFEEKWAIDGENGIGEMFAKTTIAKIYKILSLLKQKDIKIELIVKQIKDFVSERKRELRLLKNIVRNNQSLEQKIGKKQFKIATYNYTKKLNKIEEFFDSMLQKFREIENIKYKAKLCVLGDYNCNKKRDRIRWVEDVKKEKELTKEYQIKIKKFNKKIRKAIKRIIVALREKIMYLIETKYITTKKIIFKAHYRGNGEFWYLEKIFDKDYVEVVKVYDSDVKEALLKS